MVGYNAFKTGNMLAVTVFPGNIDLIDHISQAGYGSVSTADTSTAAPTVDAW